MEFNQNALLLLLVCWLLQVAGSWVQWRHFREAMSTACSQRNDGFLGVGRAKSRLLSGSVALLSVTPDLHVRELRTMSGISVFARFKPDSSVEGWPLSRLASHYAQGPRDTAAAKAIRQAITQVEEVQRRQP